ncbi:MAG: AmmeMemoRadiSam system protein A [Gammaproteobacteria bacterium]|jgi:AmmeMemoRadiSam system protein A|nr:AmmeMemoRadiSam system protein A [Gammaproteobacteria bacterium]
MNNINHGEILLPIARSSIAEMLGLEHEAAQDIPWNASWLQQRGASFVTLTQQGQLRGCIGTLEAHRSLLEDVKSNAVSAAFHDPRFSPLRREEFGYTDIEVSLLSAMQAMDFSNEQQALQQLQPGTDGLVFEYGRHRSTFLPQVWQQLPSAKDFMAHLKQKAGLSASFWDDEVRLYRYTVSKWKETDFNKEFNS